MRAMDPHLWELLQEGEPRDEVMAIIRLHDEQRLPEGVAAVTQFGKIITCRLTRADILKVRADPAVASMKAPDPVVPEAPTADEAGEDVSQMRPTDRRRPEGLKETGKGVVVGVIDWGCDFAYPSFRHPDGTTRLLALWDQQGNDGGGAPNRYGYGTIHSADEINRALKSRDPYAQLAYHPARSDAGSTGTHGTHVLDIAAGNGRAGGPVGMAPEADLVFVHLGARVGGFVGLGDSVTLLEAVDFIFRTAGERPCVINLSLGNMAGPHDGTTLVEQGLDSALLAVPGRAIGQSCGNYFGRNAHAARQIRPGQAVVFEWVTDQADVTPNEMEIWYSARDKFSVRLRSPQGETSRSVPLNSVATLEVGGRTAARIYNRPIDPNNLDNHIHIFLYPKTPAGTWLVEVYGDDVVDGRLHAWIERDEGCPQCQSKFSTPQVVRQATTGTICNGFRTITVGAYDAHAPTFDVAHFSSAGPTRDGRQKPDLCAPGVAVLAARSTPKGAPTGRPLLTRKSGTSMAAPHVTGCVALMFSAAPRPLHIEETRRLLLVNTDSRGIPPELMPRVGSGILDVRAAVTAARRPDQLTQEQTTAPPSTAVMRVRTGEAEPPADFQSRRRAPERPAYAGQNTTAMYNYRDELTDESNNYSPDPEPAPEFEGAYRFGDPFADDAGNGGGQFCPTCGQPLARGFGEQAGQGFVEQTPATVPSGQAAQTSASFKPLTLGTARIGTQSFNLVRSNPLVLSSQKYEGSLQFCFKDQLTPHHLITGNPLTGTEFITHSLDASAFAGLPSPLPPVIELTIAANLPADAANPSALVINNGEACYFPSNPLSPGTRWVQIPRLKDFYSLAAQDQATARAVWVKRLNDRSSNINVPGVTVNRQWLDGLPMPALRLLLAHLGAQMFNVTNVNQPADKFLGGWVRNGVTRPLPKIPLQEPDCYLPVISQYEGALEDINAYDLAAGISVGSIQINVIEGRLFSFLSRLSTGDPALFRQEFGTPLNWSIGQDTGHPDLVITPAGGTAVTLHGRGADADRNAGYFQSGTPGNSAFSQIDAAFRRSLTGHFLLTDVWPHVQEMIVEVTYEYLRPGLASINDAANGIPALNLNNPDRDTFVLRAMLLSAYVRFSGCLGPLLRALRRWTTVADKLSNILDAINNGTFCTKGQRANLHKRLTQQQTDAQTVHDMLRRIPSLAGTAAVTTTATSPSTNPTTTPRRAGETAESDDDCRCHGERIGAGGEVAYESWGDESESVDWGESLVGYAAGTISSAEGGESAESLVEALLEQTGLGESFYTEGGRRGLSAAEMFDSLGGAQHDTPLAQHYSRFFEVVAHPRTALPEALRPGDLLVERALGEGGVAHVSVVASGETYAAEALAEAGLTPAVGGHGTYAQVVEHGRQPRGLGEQFARRVARHDGRLGPGQMVVRLRRPGESLGAGEEQPPAPSSAPADDAGQISCGPASNAFVHADLVTAINQMRTLSGEQFTLASPACAETALCPTAFKPFHTATGDATHMVDLSKEGLRIATLAGIFGLDVSRLGSADKKSTASAKTFALATPTATPLLNLSVVAVRKSGTKENRELHLHRDTGGWGARWVQADVDGKVWKCLPAEAHPGVIYTLMKINWPRASLHRQWGKEASVAWIKALCNFYQDTTGVRLGVGDISHVVGEEMNDEHASHQLGVDVDLYVLDYPAGSTFPEPYYCVGDKKFTLYSCTPPADNTKPYKKNGPALTGAQEATIWDRYATVLAYCYATWPALNAFVWHGVSSIEQSALTIARNAFNSGWKSTWGAAPADAASIMPDAVWKKRGFKLVGKGSSSYEKPKGWPIHDDHMHIRLNF